MVSKERKKNRLAKCGGEEQSGSQIQECIRRDSNSKSHVSSLNPRGFDLEIIGKKIITILHYFNNFSD